MVLPRDLRQGVLLAVLMAAAITLAAPARAAGLDLQLNKAETIGNSCRTTFVVRNGTADDLAAAAYEMGVFAMNGQILKLVSMDFGPVAAGRTRMVQFDLPEVTCGTIGRLIVNDPPVKCVTADDTAAEVCGRDRRFESLTDIRFE